MNTETTEVYVAPDVAAIEELHHYLKDAEFRALPIREQIAKQAQTLEHAHLEGDPRTLIHLMSWYPRSPGAFERRCRERPHFAGGRRSHHVARIRVS